MKYYVYILLNPLKRGVYLYGKFNFNYEPFYVGKGCGDRCEYHSKHSDNNRLKGNIINKIKKSNKSPIIVKLYNNISEYSAFRIEKYLIKLIGRRDLGCGSLSNLTDGGEGVHNYHYTYEDKLNKLKNTYGIIKHDNNGIVIEIFENIIKLIEKYPHINPSHVHRACNTLIKVDGYYWRRFGGENIDDRLDVSDKIRSILQYDLCGNFIKLWDNVTSINKTTGYSNGAIHKCCRNNNMIQSYKYKNYMWYYYYDNIKLKIDPYLNNSSKGSCKIKKELIDMYRINGEYVNTYSPKQLKVMGFNTKTIYMCCNGKLRKSQGYKWSWKK